MLKCEEDTEGASHAIHEKDLGTAQEGATSLPYYYIRANSVRVPGRNGREPHIASTVCYYVYRHWDLQ